MYVTVEKVMLVKCYLRYCSKKMILMHFLAKLYFKCYSPGFPCLNSRLFQVFLILILLLIIFLICFVVTKEKPKDKSHCNIRTGTRIRKTCIDRSMYVAVCVGFITIEWQIG